VEDVFRQECGTSPANVPPQGRWRIYGLGLPDAILRKVCWENGARLLGLNPQRFA
jgi:hypothetical protein